MANTRPYAANEWHVGDIITAEKANRIEQAMADIDSDLHPAKDFYNKMNIIIDNINNNKILLIRNANVVADRIENLIPDGDIVKY